MEVLSQVCLAVYLVLGIIDLPISLSHLLTASKKIRPVH